MNKLSRLLAVLALVVFPMALSAQQKKATPEREMSTLPGFENRPVIHAYKMKDGETIKLDGKLDEGAWKNAIPARDFVEQEPRNGELETEKTEVRVMFDSQHLYIGAMCYDSDPKHLLRNQMTRDGNLPSDDRFQIVIDPFLNGINGYFFETNPSGVMSDSLIVGGAGGSGGFGGGGSGGGGRSGSSSDIRGWDGIWNVRVSRGDQGWSVEMVLPFRTLAFDPKAPAWGINFQRSIRRKNEEDLWNSWSRNMNLRRVNGAGLLEGLSELSQGLGLTVQPYVIGKYASNPVTGRADTYRMTGGGDLTYSLTPQVKANLTINTDFAETEVDQRQVNLTQFSLFFPERRTFFLEGSNFLSFSKEPDNLILPYFSRSIGLNSDGTPQRIEYGGKVTGQVGHYDIGLLTVRTANSDKKAGEDITVFRGRRRLLSQSYVGMLYTRRSNRLGLADTASTAGADFSLSTSRFHGNKNLELSGFYAWNTDRLKVGNNSAWGLRVEYPNDRWSGRAFVRQVGGGWSPATGFLQRSDITQYAGNFQFAPRPKNNRLIRRYIYNVSLDTYVDLAKVLRSNALNFQVFGMEFQSGDSFTVDITPSYESPYKDFQISKNVLLKQNIGYNFTRVRIGGNTSPRRVIGFFGGYTLGSFYSGKRTEVSTGFNARLHPGVLFSMSYDWNRVELTQGNFTTNTYRVNIPYQFNPRIGITQNFQYDNVTRVLGWQARFRWIVQPGNDLFIVYSQNWLDPIDKTLGFTTQTRAAATKIVYSRQF